MKIFLNKKPIELQEPATLAQLLNTNNMSGDGVAVAVDRKLVKREKWHDLQLAEGMEVIAINATCGG